MRCSLEVNSRKHVSIENKRHRFELQGGAVTESHLEWSKDSQKHDLDPLADKKFYWDSSQVSRSKVAIEQVRFRNELYKLAPRIVKTTLKSMSWPLNREKVDPWVELAPESWKLCSKVWFDQGAHSGHLAQFTLWLVKTTLKSIKWPVYMQHVHLWIDQGFSFLVEIMMKTKRF